MANAMAITVAIKIAISKAMTSVMALAIASGKTYVYIPVMEKKIAHYSQSHSKYAAAVANNMAIPIAI
jgi:hypothetical protein